MYRDKARFKQDPRLVVRSSPATFNAPLRTGKDRYRSGDRIFTCSWSDFFIREADEWRADAWEVIRKRPDLIWQILTKRPERIRDHLPPDWGSGWPQVHLGVSVENQDTAEERIPVLLRIPAAIRFLSMEPLLEGVDLLTPGLLGDIWSCPECGDDTSTHLAEYGSSGSARPLRAQGEREDACPLCLLPGEDEGIDGKIVRIDREGSGIHWIIVGGESGPHARPCRETWIRNLLFQVRACGVPIFVKQLGSHWSGSATDGAADPSRWPADLRIQQFPRGPALPLLPGYEPDPPAGSGAPAAATIGPLFGVPS
jgi:protein gp37